MSRTPVLWPVLKRNWDDTLKQKVINYYKKDIRGYGITAREFQTTVVNVRNIMKEYRRGLNK